MKSKWNNEKIFSECILSKTGLIDKIFITQEKQKFYAGQKFEDTYKKK